MGLQRLLFPTIACCFAACSASHADDLVDAAAPDAGAMPDAAPPVPIECIGDEIILRWRHDVEGEVMPSIALPGDGFYGLDQGYGSHDDEVYRFDPLGEPRVIATLPAVSGSGTNLFVRDGALHYARMRPSEIRHGALGGPESVITTSGPRNYFEPQAADAGGLFIAFRDGDLDAWFYAIYDGDEERLRGSTPPSSVHPRPGGVPVVAHLGADGRLLAAVAGEPMAELPPSADCPVTSPYTPYAILALTDGGLAWAHACSPERDRELIAVRAPTGAITRKILPIGASSVSLAEGPGGTILAALVTFPGELSLQLYDARLNELSRGGGSEIVLPETEYRFALSSVSLVRTTVGAIFAIHGGFEIPDGMVHRMAFGELCSEDL
jgi:hypothetical protein